MLIHLWISIILHTYKEQSLIFDFLIFISEAYNIFPELQTKKKNKKKI